MNIIKDLGKKSLVELFKALQDMPKTTGDIKYAFDGKLNPEKIVRYEKC